MNFQVITLMPDWVESIARYGVVGRAFEQSLAQLTLINPRDFAHDRYQSIDDRPYGGGPGMVMKPQPLFESIQTAQANIHQHAALATSTNSEPSCSSPVIYLSPQGRPLSQQLVADLSRLPALTLIAGRYEGIDERVIESAVDLEISMGDFVLSGGELPAMMLIDAIVRLLPGALGHQDSASQDSFSASLQTNTATTLPQPALDHPHYTRPEKWQNFTVPAVLASGDHRKISQWRAQMAEQRTWQRRPEQVKSRAE